MMIGLFQHTVLLNKRSLSALFDKLWVNKMKRSQKFIFSPSHYLRLLASFHCMYTFFDHSKKSNSEEKKLVKQEKWTRFQTEILMQ